MKSLSNSCQHFKRNRRGGALLNCTFTVLILLSHSIRAKYEYVVQPPVFRGNHLPRYKRSERDVSLRHWDKPRISATHSLCGWQWFTELHRIRQQFAVRILASYHQQNALNLVQSSAIICKWITSAKSVVIFVICLRFCVIVCFSYLYVEQGSCCPTGRE